ncbi:hypothetical protein WICMUC_005872 [Wickerhamomyces mucosus]|uniref:Cytokinin riboside 5'-monophosphate phosphoribohydrolase n=1 Tax=Wickerhamomyces mucosus TaxID=1378264 RepID=A0A9P8T2K9_9ASCO|nr:hypothetical protein WICMUC_005872 [Wickerhamomyces mucosus]
MTTPTDITNTPDNIVCVFCGSSFGNSTEFADFATKLGESIASKNWGLVYGGGSTGLMGAVAKAVHNNGSYVHGIIPSSLVSKERKSSDELNNELKKSIDNHNGITPIDEYGKTTVVKDMHTRKKLMGQEAQAFIALPGGYGTLEEIMEIITWSQLGIHNKPIVFANVNGFYDELLKFISSSIKSGFINVKNGDIFKVAKSVDDVIRLIEEYQVPDGRFNLNWEES